MYGDAYKLKEAIMKVLYAEKIATHAEKYKLPKEKVLILLKPGLAKHMNEVYKTEYLIQYPGKVIMIDDDYAYKPEDFILSDGSTVKRYPTRHDSTRGFLCLHHQGTLIPTRP